MSKSEFSPFLNESHIRSIIEQESKPDRDRIKDILAKGSEGKGLNMNEVAALLAPMHEDCQEELYQTAFKLKERVYGKRMVLFAPLYISNLCANSCAYCAFSANNKELKRKSLCPEEIANEVRIIQQMGHKRILAVYGEHPSWDADAVAKSVEVIYSVKTPPSGEIRRVNVNCAPLDVDGFKRLKEIGIGTYQCFQETYHRETYSKVHRAGRKKDFDWRLFTFHRAQEAGVDDVGLGVLFGLFDYRFEVLSMLRHAEVLEAEYGAGPHTISFPRIKPAQNADIFKCHQLNEISDDVFKRIIAVVRLALPYTGMIITTREKAELKRELLRLGISQLSAGSRTSPGGYTEAFANRPESQQFWVGDERELPEIMRDLQKDGYLPSFCTSCYRKGRTGDHFMDFAKKMFIHNYCQPNALMTYYEYLLDYADKETMEVGYRCILENVDAIIDPVERKAMQESLRQLKDGARDLCV